MPLSTNDLEPLLSPEKAAEILDVPAATLAAWRSTGRVRLPYIAIGGAVRYRGTDIQAFIEANRKHAGAAP